jgi:hypothetical protein
MRFSSVIPTPLFAEYVGVSGWIDLKADILVCAIRAFQAASLSEKTLTTPSYIDAGTWSEPI